MDKTGTLSIDDPTSESRLDGTLLAAIGSQNPLGDATTIVENAGLETGDRATVSPGTPGNVRGRPALFIVSAQAAVARMAAMAVARPNQSPSKARGTKRTSGRVKATAKRKRTAAKKRTTKKKKSARNKK